MKVLQVSNDYFHSNVYRTLHEALTEEKMESYYFVPTHYGDVARKEAGVYSKPCYHKMDRFFFFSKQEKIYAQFKPLIETIRPDILHAQFLYSAGYVCLKAKRDYGIPYVVTIQNTDINIFYKHMPHLRKVAAEIIKEAESVIFISASYQEHLSAKLRASMDAKSLIIPFAIDPFWSTHTFPSREHPAGSAIHAITVGLVGHGKNQLTAVKAIEILRRKGIDIDITVIGATGSPAIDQKICGYPFVRRVQQIPKEALMEEYRQADIFVLPSLTESFGLVYAEALSQGLPILYSRGQGFDKQFDEGFVGYHVDAKDEGSIAEGLLRIIKNYDVLSQNCVGACDRFSAGKVAKQLMDLYRISAS